MSLEQAPAGGLRLSYKQWHDSMKGGEVENLEKFPVPPEVQETFKGWLLGLNVLFSLDESTETLMQDLINGRFGGRNPGGSK